MKLVAKIGAIEITEDAVRVAVVKTGGRLPKVLDLVEIPIAGGADGVVDDSKAAAVKEALGRLNSRPTVYVLCVPASWSVLRLLTVPFAARRKIAAAIPFELEPALAVPIENLVIQHLPTRDVDGATQVLAIGMQRNTIEQQCDVLAKAGVRVEGVMLDAVSLTALWAAHRSDGTETSAVLHVRPKDSVLAVIEGKKLTYLRRLDIDSLSLRADPASAVHALRNALRSYTAESKSGVAIEALTIMGSNLDEAGQADLEHQLDVRVIYDDLASTLSGADPALFDRSRADTDGAVDEMNRWTAPIAAADSAAGGPFHMNFLEGPVRAGALQRSTSTHAATLCVLLIGLLAGFLVLTFADYRNRQERIERLGQAIWEEFAATYPDQAGERPPSDIGGFKSFEGMQAAAEAEREQAATLSPELFSRSPLLDVLREISRHLPQHVAAIDEITIAGTRITTLTLRGEVKESAKFNSAIKKLEESKVFTVDPRRLGRTSESGKETFVLTATL